MITCPIGSHPKVSAIFSDPSAETIMAAVSDDLQPGQYEGPISIHTMLAIRGRERGFPVVGLWGHPPVYIQTGNYKSQALLVEILKKSLGFSLDITDLLHKITEMKGRIKDMVLENPRLKEYIDELNESYNQGGQIEDEQTVVERPAAGSKGKVIPLNRFQRRNNE